MNDYPSVWSAPVVELFHVLLAEQPVLTYRAIAQRLNEAHGIRLTKNACIGYAKRAGVPNRKPAQPSRKGKKMKPRARPHKPKLRLKPRFRKRSPQRLGKLRIYELNHGECRWPVDDKTPYFFCGQTQIEGSSYCYEHTSRSCPAFARGR